jgi:hypothetical protein
MRHPKRLIWIAALPTVHLLLCAYVAVSGDIWKWILLSIVVDLPLLFVQKYVGDRCGFLLIGPWRLTIFGTAWWLCIGVGLSYIFERFSRKRSPNAPEQ